MLSPEGVLAIPLPAFDGGFGFNPWEIPAQFSTSPPRAKTKAHTQAQTYTTTLNSGSDEPDRVATSSAEERRIRRMISNRESARRSRMRKQRHLEDLRGQVDRLRSENRDLANRLGFVTRHSLVFRRDNDRLLSEAAELRSRLSDIRRILIFRKLQRLVAPPACGGGGLASGSELQTLTAPICGGFMTGNEQTLIA